MVMFTLTVGIRHTLHSLKAVGYPLTFYPYCRTHTYVYRYKHAVKSQLSDDLLMCRC